MQRPAKGEARRRIGGRVPGMARLAAAVAGAALLLGAAGYGAPRTEGYLPREALPDVARILPPPPPPGSAGALRDHNAFITTRQLEGGARWAAATHDDLNEPLDVLGDFECATGAPLNERTTPALARLVSRLRSDARALVGPTKSVFARPRPFVGTTMRICIQPTDRLASSPDYPSGHATYGWAVALVLAELDPADATAILVRGRAYGESRVVCGVHTPSAVEAGRMTGAVLVAALHGNPAFARDLDAARSEMARVRHERAPGCAASAQLLGQTPY